MNGSRIALFLLSGCLLAAAAPIAPAADPQDVDALTELARVLPGQTAGFNAQTVAAVERLVPTIETESEAYGFYPLDSKPQEILRTVEGIVNIKYRVDELLAQTVALRTEFVTLPASESRREAVRNYLAWTRALTDLSGRLRYLSYDVFNDAAFDLRRSAADREKLVDTLLAGNSSIGAAVMASLLFDPPPNTDVAPLPDRAKAKILELIRATRQKDMLGSLARFIQQPGLPAELAVRAANTIRAVGLPQQPLPDRDAALPQPEITAPQIYQILAAIDASGLDSPWPATHAALLDWLDERRRVGVTGEAYRLGSVDVRAGDWLLMRNSSPYNLFTDLNPGLFTHVGVVAARQAEDGIRRFVIVDLRERGSRIPEVTVDTFVKRTLDYVLLRHGNPQVAGRMGEVVASIIGNESKFDLNFRTEGITRLKGQDLRGKKIEGYCAGLLLLCAQETTVPLSEFFPIPEHPAGGNTLSNLAKLDVSMPRDFYSPTGSLFSTQMHFVGRRQPMYSPTREIEQAIYDHFAQQMRDTELTPSPDWFQTLRLSMAVASKDNPSLARALAGVAGVNRNMDLVAAAKLGAVVETLDEIAYGASGAFVEARNAIRSGPVSLLAREGFSRSEIQQIADYQQRHAKLFSLWESEQLAPRDLRIALVNYYIRDGKKNLDDRFFQQSAP